MSSVLGIDRRRTSSIGIEEKTLSALEQFVQLCDKGCPDDDLDESGGDKQNCQDENTTPAGQGHRGSIDSSSLDVNSQAPFRAGSKSNEDLRRSPSSGSSARAKLCELFIDRKGGRHKSASPVPSGHLAIPDKSNNPSTPDTLKVNNGTSLNNNGSSNISSNPTTPATTTQPIKKSEEIWVRRAAGGRRSFRVTNLRGQVLPSILTEDADGEGSETNEASVTTWTPGTRNPLQLQDARGRHHSGGDEFGVNKPRVSKTSALLDAFRPRSKSDASRVKKPNFMSNIRNAVQNSLLGSSGEASKEPHRPRSGSDSAKSPVSKVMDIFRTRSQSVNASDDKRKKASGSSSSWAPQGNRRASLHSHRPSDVSLDPAHAAILFRDSRGLPLSDPFIERILSLSSDFSLAGNWLSFLMRLFVSLVLMAEDEENEILVKFFKFHKCYDLIPTSAKLVVFDTQLLVKKAFFALVYNGVRAAPLWDSEERKMVGMLTITDFIRVLHAMYHDSAGVGSKMSELEEHRVETWRKRFLLNKQPLVSIDPDSSLYDAICSLVNNRIHRLPVIDKHTGNVLHILTHKRILKFLFLYIHEIPRPSCLNTKLRDVKIGSFENIETAREETPIIVALQKFLDRRVSALPIVDDQNRLLDIYARFDVINLAAEKTYNNLDITLKQANEHRNEWFEGVHKCTLEDTLFMIMEKIVKAEVHRLVVVDEEDRVVGVISLSDILQYLVMRPELKEVSVLDIEESIRQEKEILENGKAAFLQAEMDQMNYKIEPKILIDPPPPLIVPDDPNGERETPTIFEEDEKT